uniref:Uncharacterized protein n=1 Tax=Vespula pensylvanica TaxID=30213 RepID=A0A834KF57_VESPE|nr:hypothetical protein H0235_014495 [Vespula pensylvanica]
MQSLCTSLVSKEGAVISPAATVALCGVTCMFPPPLPPPLSPPPSPPPPPSPAPPPPQSLVQELELERKSRQHQVAERDQVKSPLQDPSRSDFQHQPFLRNTPLIGPTNLRKIEILSAPEEVTFSTFDFKPKPTDHDSTITRMNLIADRLLQKLSTVYECDLEDAGRNWTRRRAYQSKRLRSGRGRR